MYATTVGRTFLKAYNQKFEKDYTARAFFEEVFISLFFDHTKYMMTAGNSPLENPKISWDDMIKGKKNFETQERRQERISKMIHKIESERADASIAVGYGVVDSTAATSGQITNIDFPDNKDDIYLSWIGAGLGIGVAGGLTLLFDHEQLLLDIFDGWKHYRDYLERYPTMKGNQINTWNGRWIAHRYGNEDFDEAKPTAYFNPLMPASEGLLNLQTIEWSNVLLGIARNYSLDNLVGYLYSIGQSNSTIGFIPFKLKDIIRPCQLYAKIFGESTFKQDALAVEKLLGTGMGLRAACQAGAIGVASMEPKGLRTFFPTEKGTKKVSFNKREDGEQKIIFNTYLIWILAMLNNEKLWDLSQEIAELLLKYEAGAGKARSNRVNNVNQLFESTTAKLFLQRLIPIIEDEEQVEMYRNLGKIIHSMPKDNVPYFNILIRFQYALLNK